MSSGSGGTFLSLLFVVVGDDDDSSSSSTDGKSTLSASALSNVKIGMASIASGDGGLYSICNDRFDPPPPRSTVLLVPIMSKFILH